MTETRQDDDPAAEDPPKRSALPEDRGEKPWFTSAFDQSYVDRYAHRDDAEARQQIDTLIRDGHLGATPGGASRVLDLCCGAGRHLGVLRQAGIRAVGADLSADLIRAARAANPASPLLRADMATLPFRAGAFAAVIQMFTAFGYFESDAENQQVLTEVARVLAPSGVYALDLMNRTPLIRNLVAESSSTLGDGSEVTERRSFDSAAGRVNKHILTRSSSGERTSRRESVRVLSRDEITSWMRAAGLDVIRMYGDYAGADYDVDRSPRMLVITRRGH